MIMMTDVDDNISNQDNVPAGLETQDDKRFDSQNNNTGMIATDNTMLSNRADDLIMDQTEDIIVAKDSSKCKRISSLIALFLIIPAIVVFVIYLDKNAKSEEAVEV